MKKTLLSSALLLITATLFSQGYSIRGKIKGWKDTLIFLGNHYGNKQYVKDTVRIDKTGNFHFTGKEPLPGGIYLIVYPNKVYSEVLIDKEQNFSMEIDTAKMVENMKFKGSEENTQFYKFQNFIAKKYKESDPWRKAYTRIQTDSTRKAEAKKDSLTYYQNLVNKNDKEVQEYRTEFIKNHPGTLQAVIFKAQEEVPTPEAPTLPNGRKDSTFGYRFYKDHYWDNIPPDDDRLLRSPLFHAKLKYFFDKVVLLHPDSVIKEGERLIALTKGNKETFKYVVWYMTLTFETSNIMGMDAVFVHLVDKYYATKQAYWVDSIQIQKILHRGNTLRPLLIGKQAPPIIMQDSLGRNVSLYEIKSKYTVLVFWDPDCGHCQKVMPKLRDEYENKLKKRGVTVMAVDIEDSEEKWKQFIRDKKMVWLNVRDKYHQYYLRQLYDIYSTPVTYLLDENKIIRAKRIDPENLNGFLDFLEKQKESEKKGG